MAVWSRVVTMCRRITTTITVGRHRRRRIIAAPGRIIGKWIENPLARVFLCAQVALAAGPQGTRQQKSLPFPAG
jgi:hypothetical protein